EEIPQKTGQPPASLEIITEREKRQILLDFNDREETYPNDKTIPKLFEEQVVKTPHGIAVVSKYVIGEKTGRCLTYSQLDSEAHRLAGVLIGKGMAAGDIAGIVVERSLEMIVSIIAVLKTGAAYLPLNPQSPEDRNRYMLNDSRAKLCLTTTNIFKGFKMLTECEIEWILLDEPGIRPVGGAYMQPDTAGARGAVPEKEDKDVGAGLPLQISSLNSRTCELAYVIYTSGSTGRPKGVPINHRNFCPLILWGYRHLQLNSRDKVVQNLSYYFDWSVWEIFITLTTGACLTITSEEIMMDSPSYADFIGKNGITALHITPSQLHALTGYEAEPVKLETLRYLFIGAEKLTVDLLKRSYRVVKKDCRVFNMYGPTEATIIASVLEVDRSDEKTYDRHSSVPIGIPVANAALLILGQGLQLCPVNVPGELVIAGDGLASGYLNNPELTSEKFIPFASGGQLFEKSRTKTFDDLKDGAKRSTTNHSALLYKTGDLARWLPDGNIEFLGRMDRQVKIRGYRIELGEIENRLLLRDDIKEVLVTVRSDAEGGKSLCAYIVGMQNHGVLSGDLDAAELREHISGTLPGYMIPSFFVQ
ncbi:MAG: amino acid adenylation domain-containing protein, partial [Candidatus Aminicenantes bacterium]|nr:amino acid adenylation domain-containing protein [Candidatus Aminicenantes bacterium]